MARRTSRSTGRVARRITPSLSPQGSFTTITLSRSDGVPFALQWIDLSPRFNGQWTGAVTFTGHKTDGTTVTQAASFGSTLGLYTTTFQGFTNLLSVTWTDPDITIDAQFTNLALAAGGATDFTGVDFGAARTSGAHPLASADAYSGTQNAVLTVPGPGVLANDNDSLGDPIGALAVTNPTHGTLTLNLDGSFT